MKSWTHELVSTIGFGKWWADKGTLFVGARVKREPGADSFMPLDELLRTSRKNGAEWREAAARHQAAEKIQRYQRGRSTRKSRAGKDVTATIQQRRAATKIQSRVRTTQEVRQYSRKIAAAQSIQRFHRKRMAAAEKAYLMKRGHARQQRIAQQRQALLDSEAATVAAAARTEISSPAKKAVQQHPARQAPETWTHACKTPARVFRTNPWTSEGSTRDVLAGGA